MDPWQETSAAIKKVLNEKEENLTTPVTDVWRVPYLSLLLEQRQTAHYGGMEEEEERLSGLIESLCIN